MSIALQNKKEACLLSYIDEHKEMLFSTLSDLVRIDTQNFGTSGNENAGQDRLAELCHSLDLTVERFAPDSVSGLTALPDYMPGRATDVRENLVAVYAPKKGMRRMMLASHMDTVKIGDPTLWEGDPFSGTIKDGKLYGRGAGDDKFGLAVAYFLIKAFKDTGIDPGWELSIGSYVDEEGGGGGGALGLALAHPVDCLLNLDASGFECEALGGGCFEISLSTTQNDTGIASVFDVFTGLNLIKEELEALHGQGKNTIRLSTVTAGTSGDKSGKLSFAIYTDMSKEETGKTLEAMLSRIRPRLDALHLATEGFLLKTRFFLYGETSPDSHEAALLSALIEEETGVRPDTRGTCLSDLSLLLAYGTKNSFNYGIPRGSKTGGGAHQPNEHIHLETLLSFAKTLALLILRS